MSPKAIRRYTYDDFTEETRPALLEWIRSLGVDPADVSVNFAISSSDEGFHLHLTEFLRDQTGRRFIDHAAECAASRPLVLPVDPATWPEFLPTTGKGALLL